MYSPLPLFCVLVIEGLTKHFPRARSPAIQAVDLEVRDGEVVGFVGVNGAGKTTTIRIAVGVALPTSGSVSVDGHDIVAAKEEASRGVGWVPEFPNFEPEARALEHLIYLAGFHRIRSSEARARGRELLARVGLGEVERGKIRTFSQGMKKRFALAAAMLHDPPNYLLDEVLNGLDPEGIRFVREWLREGKREHRAMLLSSHILSEVQLVADRIVVIHHGRILRTLRVDELDGLSRRAIRLKVDNLDAAGLEFLRTQGEVRADDATHVRVEGAELDPATLNQELVRRGYRVSQLDRDQADLEEYFLELTRTAG